MFFAETIVMFFPVPTQRALRLTLLIHLNKSKREPLVCKPRGIATSPPFFHAPTAVHIVLDAKVRHYLRRYLLIERCTKLCDLTCEWAIMTRKKTGPATMLLVLVPLIT